MQRQNELELLRSTTTFRLVRLKASWQILSPFLTALKITSDSANKLGVKRTQVADMLSWRGQSETLSSAAAATHTIRLLNVDFRVERWRVPQRSSGRRVQHKWLKLWAEGKKSQDFEHFLFSSSAFNPVSSQEHFVLWHRPHKHTLTHTHTHKWSDVTSQACKWQKLFRHVL